MAVWSTGGNGWGNGTNVATDQNPGRTQTSSPSATGWNGSIEYVYAFGSQIKSGQKLQWEIIVHQGGGVHSPWWFLQTAFETGAATGASNGYLLALSYNQGVARNGTVAGSTISDPEGDENNNGGAGWPGSPIPAAPSWFIDGTVITCLCDRVANQMTFIIHGATGASIGGHTYGTSGTSGPYDISSWGTNTVYPFCLGWWIGGFTITINGGGAGQTLQYPQSGYTNLDGATVTGTGMTAISTPVSSPNPVTVGLPFSVTVTGTGGPFSSAGNALISAQLHGASPSYEAPSAEAAGATVVLSGNTATFSGLIANTAAVHDIEVYDSGNQITSPIGSLGVNAAVSTTQVAINSPAVRVSPFVWGGSTSRTDSISRTTGAVGAWIDFYINTSASPAAQINLSNTGGTSVLYDYLIGGTIAQTAQAATGGVLNITGLPASGANQWLRLYFGSDAGTLSPVTISSLTLDSASTAGTAPAAKQSLLFVGDGICQPFGLEAVQSFVFLMAQSLGLGTWDMVDSSYGGNGWIVGSEGTDPYDQPSVTSRWNLLYPGGPSNLDSTGVFSALGSTNTPPHAICFFLGASDCLAAVSIPALTTAITAAMAQHRTASSPSTALIILMPFGLYDSVAYPTGLTYVAAIQAAVLAANQAGSNVTIADPGSAFGISMRTGGYLGADNKTPLATGHSLLAATYLPLILPLLTVQAQNPATITITVPSPLLAGTQPVYGNFSNGTNPANLWLAWSPNQYIVTANAVLAAISGSSFSATMNLTAPSTSTSGGKSIGVSVASSMWYSTNANQSTTTITDPSLGVITLPSPIADQLLAAPVSVQFSFNYLPASTPVTLVPGVNVGISVVPTGVAPIFVPIGTSTTLPVGAAITVPASIPNQQTTKPFSIQVGFNYVPNRANLYYTPPDVAATSIINGITVCAFSAGLSNGGTITWDPTGQIATFTFNFNTATSWSFQIYDQSGAGLKSSLVTFVTQTAAGGGGTTTVPTPGAPLQVTGTANVLWSQSGQVATVTLANAVLGTFDLQIQDSTYSTPILSPIVTYNVTGVATAAAATLTVPTPAAPILLQDQQNGTWTQAPGNWLVATVATSQTLTLNLSNNTTITRTVALGASILNQTIQLYTFFLFSPPQTTPNTSVTLFGEFVAGVPTQLDYTTNGGANWVLAPAANVSITAITAQNPPPAQVAGINTPITTPTLGAATGAFSLVIPLGVAAGTYAAGQIMVRDHNVTSVFAACGQWVVAAFTMASLTTGTSIFDFDPAIPACVTLNANGTVYQMKDASGSGRHMSIGPTALPASPPLGSTTWVRAPGADVLDAAAVGPPATFVHLSGADSTRTLIGFTPTSIADNVFDPTANFASFGALGGPNDAIINLMNTTSMEVGTQTFVQALYIDITVFGGVNAGYGIGLLWGDWLTSTTVQYMTPGRWHAGQFACQFDDATSGMFVSPSANIGVSTWAVVTCQRNGTLFQWRINKGAWNVGTLTSTGPFTPTYCGWGGSVANGLNQPGGNAFRLCGAIHIIQGVLSAAELALVESLTGQSVGLAI